MSEPAVRVERRSFTDRRENSPTLKEWLNGLSVLGKLTVLVAGVLGGGATAVGATTVLADAPRPDVSHLSGRLDALEKRTEALGAVVGASLRSQCLHTSDSEVFYLRLPCDSLMSGFAGWRTMRAESLRAQSAGGLR